MAEKKIIRKVFKTKRKMATARRTWKLFEQRVADLFGAKRTPLSGMSDSITKSDIIHRKIFAECKLREKFPVWDLFKETEEKAKKENKIPIVAIQKKGQKGFLLIVKPEDLEKIVSYVKRKGEILESRT